MLPELEKWDYSLIEKLVLNRQGETDSYEFKKYFIESKNITSLVCSFANTDGGFIILGIDDSTRKEFTIKGIEFSTELGHDFRKLIHADPHIYFEGPKIINVPNSSKIIAVFYIPKSQLRPHLPTKAEERFFWKRTNGGKEHMTYLETRMSFQNFEERREKIKLLYVELMSNKYTLQKILESVTSEEPTLYSPSTLEYNILNILLSDLYSIIGKDPKLIKNLIDIRFVFNAINNESGIFFGRMSNPIGEREPIICNHKTFLKPLIDEVLQILDQSLSILEVNYGLKNPLENAFEEKI